MFKLLIATYVFIILLTTHAFAFEKPPAYIKAYVPTAQAIGEGTLTFFFTDVYDAVFYAPTGTFRDEPPFALKLTYLRDLKGKSIAQTSAQEMRRLGFTDNEKLSDWKNQMIQIFPDVAKDVTLTGVYTKDKSTIFFKNGKKIGEIKDPAFGQWFFSIWLDERTRAPDLRQALIGARG